MASTWRRRAAYPIVASAAMRKYRQNLGGSCRCFRMAGVAAGRVQSVRTARNRTAPREPMDTYSGARYTIEELSRIVGMSARNIRAHQERKLLDPPVRHHRVGYYDDGHRRRLEQIKAMQRQGFNLAAIVALIGDGEKSSPGRSLAPVLRQLAEHPALAAALTRHDVVARDDDGSLRPVRPELLLSALGMRRFGVPPAIALRFLAEILEMLESAEQDQVGVETVADCARLSVPRYPRR